MDDNKEKILNLKIGNSLCNNNCIFCADGEKKKQSLIPKKELFSTLKKWREKTDCLVFCGSDPTLNPYLCDTIKEAKKLKYSEIRLITNGRLLSYFNFAKKIVESGLTEICISFHGSCPAIQDAQTRIPGSFSQTFNACQNLSVLKSSHKFKWYINYTFNKLNAADFYDFFKMILSFDGLNGFNIAAVMPQGLALKYFDIVVPNYSELGKIFKRSINRLNKTPALKKRMSDVGFRVTGLPFCVMKNCEYYVNDYRDQYILKNPRNKKIKTLYGALDRQRLIGAYCKSCYYYNTCPGVWKEYTKRRGWKEFKPIKNEEFRKNN